MQLLVTIVAALFALPLAVGVYFTRRTARDPNHATFAKGRLPDPLPDGLYSGTVPGYERLAEGWKGKRFDSATSTGTNLVRARDRTTETYPFRTYAAKGLQDRDSDVLRVDYDIPENPFWLRACADELVEVAPGQYLGKAYIRLVPDHPFAMLFFELRKQEPTATEENG
jgi:hypothetical protein